MEDIVPGLLEKLQNDFYKKYQKDTEIRELVEKLEEGLARHAEAYAYAGKVGSILADTYADNLSSDVLPEGKMWYNIGNRVIAPTLEENYRYISDYVSEVQAQLNQAAGIGIKPIVPPENKDRAKGIIDRLSSEDDFDKVAWILKEPIKTTARSIVDDSIKANAEFHGKAGMQPKIIRKSSGKCCKWCNEVAGVYSYLDVPNDIYRRHENCDCIVEYDPGNGKRQNVHTKQWRDVGENDKIEERKQIGLGSLFQLRTANMSPDEYARAVDLWNSVEEVEGLSQREKEYVYEEFDNNLTPEEKESAVVCRPIGDFWYHAVNKGHNQYKIYSKRSIQPARDIVDEVLTEMFGTNWEEMLGDDI